MLLLVGLGNPGPKYARHRHNIGFMAVDAIHARHDFGPWRARFQADVSEGRIGSRKVLLMKPMTSMNLSGNAVGEAVRFFKLEPDQILVIYDEIDLPPGKLRMKDGGGHGGHNGLRSLHGQLGPYYRRMRLGVGHPGRKELVAGYVLHDFAKSDAQWLDPLLDVIAAEAPLLADDKDSTFMNRVHLALRGEDDKPARSKNKSPKTDQPPDNGAAPAGTNPPVTAENKTSALADGLSKLFGRNKDTA